ncbi:hypothetical protein XBI1_1570125 [Xenorhabdus bovienii str. Intermedium]|uniref:Uncharacterized protein n=1 Tax=Xenorhabdus bovienii str. Intermedium TaxID=1379677 RepID=A0A077QH95_XENBV|nr:hypothetical protein XBI1_1570125 [Xenorhabdus bovienii str. Intermedium]
MLIFIYNFLEYIYYLPTNRRHYLNASFDARMLSGGVIARIILVKKMLICHLKMVTKNKMIKNGFIIP